jgi:hypothetical protein
MYKYGLTLFAGKGRDHSRYNTNAPLRLYAFTPLRHYAITPLRLSLQTYQKIVLLSQRKFILFIPL